MTARDAILGRVREALGPAPEVPAVPRDYTRAGGREPAGDPATVERFAERVADYAATVHRTSAADAPALIAGLLEGERVVAAPRPLEGPASNRGQSPGFAPTADEPGFDTAALDAFDAVLTGCAVAVADTGTIVLDGGAESGRRAITLIPDHHVCVVRAEQVVAAVPEAIAAIGDAVAARRPITFVSGPSATSDIELERVEGVHGPRRLDVVLVGP